MSVIQRKETGTTVDFTNARDIDLQKYCFRGDVFGVYAYQGAPATIPATVRDAFLNGNLGDLQAQASGQGMPLDYILITWNEVQSGSDYSVTDLAVGVVSTPSSYINVGPAYLIDALKAVPWFRDMASRLSLPWKAWELISETRPSSDVPFYRFTVDGKGSSFFRSAPIANPIPDPPTEAELITEYQNTGRIEEALGEFAKKMLDGGYTVTFLGYRVEACLQRSPEIRIGTYHQFQYVAHARLAVEYKTNPELPTSTAGTRALVPIIIWQALAIFIVILAIGLGSGSFFAPFVTETQVQETITEYYDPVTGKIVRRVIDRDTRTGPADWWAWVTPIIALIGAGAVAFIVLQLIPRRKSE